jgi:hypothetical protein
MSEPTASPEQAASPQPAAPPEPAAPPPDSTRTGPGRVLIAIYALFALSASARAAVQIATKFSHAPVAYLLSALAAVIYILATVTLAVGSPAARRIAVLSCSVELVGVLAVGTWSLADRATFPDATVWSGYGSGYGFVPLVLPVLGLLWLRHWSRRDRTQGTAVTSAADADEPARSKSALRALRFPSAGTEAAASPGRKCRRARSLRRHASPGPDQPESAGRCRGGSQRGPWRAPAPAR